jgi:K+-sensing histidine kinase KdpD
MKPPLWQNLRDVIIYAISHLNFSSIEKVIGLTNLEIFADPLLEKAMVNIIQCAILGEGKTTFVEIHPAVHGGAVVVSITGNNQGFTTEERESLFQHSVGDQKGLGLFLAREILSITGITVTETGQPGSGTRFELLVPDGVWRYADKKDVGITPPSP